MRAPSVPWSSDLDGERPADGVPAASHLESTAIRMWLVQGTRAIDPRRVRGSHGPARQLLAENGAPAASAHDRWSGFVSALQRHTVVAALAQLSERERQVLTLAFVHGHSNREIAAMLSISASSVGRRLSSGLEKLENQMWRAGTWLSALLLLLLGYISGRAAIAHRLTGAVRSAGWTEIVALSAAATVTAIALGAVVAENRAAPPRHPAVATAGVPFSAGSVTASTQATSASPGAPGSQVEDSRGKPAGGAASTHTGQAAAGPAAATDPGCDGNPTNAPPAVPVGPRGRHPAGSPVTHPTAGGCGPHGVERP